MNRKLHWETAYQKIGSTAVSWYRPHLETSLRLIVEAAHKNERIIDIGGGASTLVDDLISSDFSNIAVLDISHSAIQTARLRLGSKADTVQWLESDIARPGALPAQYYHVWHDRAVFHFLTDSQDRQHYIENVRRSVIPGGTVIVATFATDGPTRCSGLDVDRYDSKTLHHEFGEDFELMESIQEIHKTPLGVSQSFVYCRCTMRALSTV
jgi:SAM-dependent methyltransferase